MLNSVSVIFSKTLSSDTIKFDENKIESAALNDCLVKISSESCIISISKQKRRLVQVSEIKLPLLLMSKEWTYNGHEYWL